MSLLLIIVELLYRSIIDSFGKSHQHSIPDEVQHCFCLYIYMYKYIYTLRLEASACTSQNGDIWEKHYNLLIALVALSGFRLLLNTTLIRALYIYVCVFLCVYICIYVTT